MFYIQRKTDRVKIKEGDLSGMFIINNLDLNNIIDQALIIIHRSVCPEKNTQLQKTGIYQETHFLFII